MYFDLAPLHFNILLGWEAHQRAESIRRHYSKTSEANQAYCYALSRSVGEMYLKTKGFNVKETDFSTWNFNTQHITDIACVDIEGIGRVQFIPATTAMNSVKIISEARSNKVAYVIVQLDEESELLEELNEAILVGFANRVEAEKLSLEGLSAIDELPEYLLYSPKTEPSQETQRENILAKNVRQWLEQMLQTGWRKIEDLSEALLPPEQEKEAYAQSAQVEADLQICKTICLDDNKQEIGICINLIERSDPTPKFNVLVEVFAPQINAKPKMFWSSQKFLPSGLEIFLIVPPDTVCHHIKLSTKKQRVPLEWLTVFGGTQIEVKIESSKFNYIESFRIPD